MGSRPKLANRASGARPKSSWIVSRTCTLARLRLCGCEAVSAAGGAGLAVLARTLWRASRHRRHSTPAPHRSPPARRWRPGSGPACAPAWCGHTRRVAGGPAGGVEGTWRAREEGGSQQAVRVSLASRPATHPACRTQTARLCKASRIQAHPTGGQQAGGQRAHQHPQVLPKLDIDAACRRGWVGHRRGRVGGCPAAQAARVASTYAHTHHRHPSATGPPFLKQTSSRTLAPRWWQPALACSRASPSSPRSVHA